jgi:ribosomal protein S18 acetylase RimI-like enzyme
MVKKPKIRPGITTTFDPTNPPRSGHFGFFRGYCEPIIAGPPHADTISRLSNVCYPDNPLSVEVADKWVIHPRGYYNEACVSFILLKEDCPPIGYLLLDSSDKNYNSVVQLGIHPDHRRLYFGWCLMLWAIMKADLEVKPLLCDIRSENHSGADFLKSMGFHGERYKPGGCSSYRFRHEPFHDLNYTPGTRP